MNIYRLPYQANSAALFAHFAHAPYAIFLDSCGVERFDIIVADPSECFVAQPGDDPFAVAKAWQMNLPPASTSHIPEEIPFTTGIMGYFSYDLGYELVGIQSKAIKDITLPLAVVGNYDWSIVVDHHLQLTYFITHLDLTNPKIITILKLLEKPVPIHGHFELTSNFLPNINKLQYGQAFKKIQQHLLAGDCYQINLAQRFTANYIGSPWAAYQSLQPAYQMPMAAFINLPEGALLSFSPERFLQVIGNEVITQPIKGTSQRFSNPKHDLESAQALLASEKNRAENIMIVDLLRNDLSKCCRPGSISVPKLCRLESFTQIHHLVSTISGILEEGQHPFDLLRHCFPGGSITGAPKRRAMEIIDSIEPQHRSVYCGSIAYCDVRGRMDSNIAIRTLLCAQQKIHCYGGGGIVIDSSMENEYHEIQVKIFKLLNILEKKMIHEGIPSQ